MNMHVLSPKSVEVEMSADGEIMIPEAIRRAAGLIPGGRLVMGVNDRGEAVLMTRTQARRLGETPDQRRVRIRNALDDMAGRFSTGQSTAEIMDELRGNRAP